MKIIEVYGTRRSGHHGIIAWMKWNFDAKYGKAKVGYLNDLTNNHGLRGDALYGKINEFKQNDTEVLFVSYEDEYTSMTRVEGSTTKFVVLRDILNNAASRYKAHPKGAMMITEKYVDIWKEHAAFPKLIKYEDFLMHKEIRDEFSLSLGVENIDVTNDMHYCSNIGSSFIGKNVDSIDNYLNRYKMIDLPESVINLIQTEEIRQVRLSLGYTDIFLKAPAGN